VPIVLTRAGDDDVSGRYPLLDEYLAANYRHAGSSDFGGSPSRTGMYNVLVRKDRRPARLHAPTSLPCFD
jgi:hypothetical protein